MAHGGKAVGRAGGKAVFVPFAIPDETVHAEVYRSRKRYSEAELRDIVVPSPDRVLPQCPYFGVCGGCQLQHVSYERQLGMKRQVVMDLLQRVGGFPDAVVLPTLPSPLQYGYRNSARFLGGARGDLGYTDWRNNQFMRVDTCPIMAPPISEVLPQLQGRGRPREQVRVRYSEATDQLAIWPAVNAPVPSGQPYLEYELLGKRLHVSSTSFFQVNTHLAESLITVALERLRPMDGRVVLDAYSGVGAFTCFIAQEAAGVIAIEESPSAVADARLNLTGLGVRLIQGRTEDEIARLSGPIDLVLLDPPRTGCEPPALDALLAMAPERIVYISCEPSTLARDLHTLCSTGVYGLRDVQPADMFPQTYHIEAVATLDLQ